MSVSFFSENLCPAPGAEKEGIENLIENDKNSKKHFNPLKRFDKNRSQEVSMSD